MQAYRVPFENFAALSSSGSVAPLQLIIEAVSASLKSGGGNEAYSVFGSTLVEILLEFKWQGFARRKYYRELAMYVAHVIFILIWNILSHQLVLYDDPQAFWSQSVRELSTHAVVLVILWLWTTTQCMNLVTLLFRELMAVGCRVLLDPWNVIELLYVVCQMVVNVLFLWCNHTTRLHL